MCSILNLKVFSTVCYKVIKNVFTKTRDMWFLNENKTNNNNSLLPNELKRFPSTFNKKIIITFLNEGLKTKFKSDMSLLAPLFYLPAVFDPAA